MAEKKVTIKDVAREAGVSITTVSRYLNQNYDSMSKETKDRIEAVIENMRYQPNKMAQGLKGQTRTIAVIVVNIGYPFCVSVIRSISDVLNEAGYSLMVCETGGDPKKELTLLRSLVAQGVDGIIIQTNGNNNEQLAELATKMPIVIIDRQFPVPGSGKVVTNNLEASQHVTEALYAQGYEKIVFVSEPLQGLSTRIERLDGYKNACEQYKKEPCIVWANRKDTKSLEACVETLRTNGTSPFAVYTSNGLLMMQLYPLLTMLGYKVPVEMGLATFDEPDWVTITQPKLTCVRQPTAEMGQLAANTVLEQLRSGASMQRITAVHVIPSEVVLAGATQLKV